MNTTRYVLVRKHTEPNDNYEVAIKSGEHGELLYYLEKYTALFNDGHDEFYITTIEDFDKTRGN